ncbi:MAG TPA: glycosyltransferase family 39 protein [Candidatus Woesebacteria bacterium]|nr:glycosyltransferase family 39 protein [Candidatus Woesebacteria bacterium]
MKKYTLGILLLLILGLALFLRVWRLDTIPVAISNDEVVRVYNAYSVWKTGGYTVDNRFLPLSTSPDGQDLSPVSFYLSAPISGIFGLNLFTARIGYSLMGVLSVLGIFLLGSHLFNRKIGLLSAFVLAVSPWHILVSRGAWDAGVAMCWYIFAVYFFIKYVGTNKIFLAVIFFLLGLYSYHGTVLFFGLMLVVLFWIYREKLLKTKTLAIISVTLLAIGTLPILHALFFGDLSRDSVFFWKSEHTNESAEKRVLDERALSMGPSFVINAYNNKLTYLTKEVSFNYLQAFSFEHLFIRGDINRINGYGNYFWGAMHLIELPFLLIGLYFVARQKLKVKAVIIAGLLIAPVTSALILVDRSYLFRSIMMIPFLTIITGAGFYYAFSKLRSYKKAVFLVLVTLVGIIYMFFISKHAFTYIYQYGVFGGEHLFKSSRDVAEYVEKNKQFYNEVYVYTPEYYFLLQYAFFNKIQPDVMQKLWSKPEKWIGNVRFVDWCISPEEFGNPDEKHGVLYLSPITCTYSFEPLTSINDSEVAIQKIWNIYER